MNQALERILLHHLEGSRAGQVDSFTQPVVVVGRAPDCHVMLASDKGVSSHHCEIRQGAGQFELVDTNSTNGTFVGDERISSHVLKSGDNVRFGWMGPVVKVEFDEAVRAVHPAHPLGDAQSTVMVSARHIAAAAGALAEPAPAIAEPKAPAITMPPPSRVPVAPAPPVAAPPAAPRAAPPSAATGAAPPPRPAPPAAQASTPAVAGAGWSGGRWALALAVVVLLAALAAVAVWKLFG